MTDPAIQIIAKAIYDNVKDMTDMPHRGPEDFTPGATDVLAALRAAGYCQEGARDLVEFIRDRALEGEYHAYLANRLRARLKDHISAATAGLHALIDMANSPPDAGSEKGGDG